MNPKIMKRPMFRMGGSARLVTRTVTEDLVKK